MKITDSTDSRIRILHLDDDWDDLELTSLKLGRMDSSFAIKSVADPGEALELLAREDYDCIVSDYQMPHMNGLDFLKTVRDKGINTPFVMFTAQGNERLAVEVFNAGASDYFSKQMEFASFDRLSHSIKRNVELHKSRSRRGLIEHALSSVVEATSPHTGPEFFASLVLALQSSLKVDAAFVGERTAEDEITTRAFVLDNELLKNTTYTLEGTPCKHVVENLECVHESGVYRQYPDEPFINKEKIEAYIGCALVNREKEVVGLLSIMNREPLQDSDLYLDFLRIFAMRVSVELERNLMLLQLKSSEANYRAIFEDGMDATAIVDADSGRILKANRAYIDFHGFDKEEVIGKTAKFFSALPERYDHRRIMQMINQIKAKKKIRVQWLSRDSAGRNFWAEADLKLVVLDGSERIIVQPRDISERKPYTGPLADDESHFVILERAR